MPANAIRTLVCIRTIEVVLLELMLAPLAPCRVGFRATGQQFSYSSREVYCTSGSGERVFRHEYLLHLFSTRQTGRHHSHLNPSRSRNTMANLLKNPQNQRVGSLKTLVCQIVREHEAFDVALAHSQPDPQQSDFCQWQDKDLQAARMALIEASRALLQQALGPVEYVKDEIPIVSVF